VKPVILSCFGDIGLALEGNFVSYLPHVMQMLQHASMASQQTLDDSAEEEEIEQMNQLRVSIFEAYAGIFQGLQHQVRTPHSASIRHPLSTQDNGSPPFGVCGGPVSPSCPAR
jgi:importin subunit beta-1